MTLEDRERIAQGLTEGLGFAEISRRLGRPTSTVSREVNRNGGAGGYRPDQADAATRERTRRQRLQAAGSAERSPVATQQVADKLTEALIASGLTRMSSRVLACLCTTDNDGLTAADLVQRLQVSPASVSKAVAELETMNLIGRERDQGRRDRYVVDNEIWYRALLASARFSTNLAEIAREGAETLDRSTPAGARMSAMSGFFDHVGRETIAAAERYRHLLTH